MNYFLPTLNFMLQCSYALYNLPAPVNVSVVSHNFHHVLQWSPGPGTPPGTVYNVYRSKNDKPKLLPNPSNLTRKTVLLRYPTTEYTFYVQASHNNFQSNMTKSDTFCPFEHTIIDPPKLSLIGCGNCLLVGIQSGLMPGMNSTIAEFYRARFSIFWRKASEEQVQEEETKSLNHTISHLDPYVEYCVRVRLKTPSVNVKTAPTNWTCAYTSIVEPKRLPAVLVGVSALLIVGIGIIFVPMVGLVYTGFVCKQKRHLPRALLTVLVQEYLLAPERTIPDLVSIAEEPEEQEKTARRNAQLHLYLAAAADMEEEEEDDDEDEEGNKAYMDRPARLSLGMDSQDASGASLPLPEATGDSGGLSAEVVAEGEEPVGGTAFGNDDGREVEVHEARVSLGHDEEEAPAGPGHGLGGDRREGDRAEEGDTPGDVNLFSVILGTLAREEEEEAEADAEEDNLINFLVVSKKQSLLPMDVQRTLRVASVVSEGQKQTGEEMLLTNQTDRPLLPDCPLTYSDYDRCADSTDIHTGYLVTHTGNMQTGDDDDEEEENCSGYMMGH